MQVNEYKDLALRTESSVRSSLEDLGINGYIPDLRHKFRLLHAALGLATEAGELIDMLKKHIFYGKQIDLLNAQEEIGDSMWYIALASDAVSKLVRLGGWGVEDRNLEEIMIQNIAKLRARYPDKFTAECAINRNINNEQEVLKNG